MRFMVIVKATEDSEKGALPSQDMLEAMGAYNEELVKAGIMLDGDGLRPSSHGARVRFDENGNTTVVDAVGAGSTVTRRAAGRSPRAAGSPSPAARA